LGSKEKLPTSAEVQINYSEFNMHIVPVILSGGSGTRLWPASRQSRPKQFLSLVGDETLIQLTLKRCTGRIFNSPPIMIGANDHRFLLGEAVAGLGIQADIILEPVGKNSAAAIAVACLWALRSNPDPVLMVMAADHLIPEKDKFQQAVAEALEAVEQGYLVTFGITPDGPNPNYGYIEPGEKAGSCKKVNRFVEKPDLETSAEYLRAGMLWNSGNFLFQASVMLEELNRFEPEMVEQARAAVANGQNDLDFFRLDMDEFSKIKSISIDHAVMEQTERAAVLPVDYSWSDIGNWDGLAATFSEDENGNRTKGNVHSLASSGNVVHTTDQLVTTVGLSDTIIVATRDAILVADRSGAEQIRTLVDQLKDAAVPQATEHLQGFRPWGSFESLELSERYHVKRLVVYPGGELSLQKHSRRAEHWIVVSGTAEITREDELLVLEANQSTYIPLGAVHRLANRGDTPLVVIEVQTGDYFGEDDIIRLEDNYNRV